MSKNRVYANNAIQANELGPIFQYLQPNLKSSTLDALHSDPNDILHRLREFFEIFVSMKILPDLIWWLQPELASKMPERKI